MRLCYPCPPYILGQNHARQNNQLDFSLRPKVQADGQELVPHLARHLFFQRLVQHGKIQEPRPSPRRQMFVMFSRFFIAGTAITNSNAR